MPSDSSSWLFAIGVACAALITFSLSSRKARDDEGNSDEGGDGTTSEQPTTTATSRRTDEVLQSLSSSVERRKQLLRRVSARSNPSPTLSLNSDPPSSNASPSATWRDVLTPDIKRESFTPITPSTARYSTSSTSTSVSDYSFQSPEGRQVTLTSELQEKREANNRIGIASLSPKRHETVTIASTKKGEILREIESVHRQIAMWQGENEPSTGESIIGRNEENVIDLRYLREKLSCLRNELLTVEKNYIEQRKQDRKQGLQEVKARLRELQSSPSSQSYTPCKDSNAPFFVKQENYCPYPLDEIRKQELELVKEAYNCQLKERGVVVKDEMHAANSLRDSAPIKGVETGGKVMKEQDKERLYEQQASPTVTFSETAVSERSDKKDPEHPRMGDGYNEGPIRSLSIDIHPEIPCDDWRDITSSTRISLDTVARKRMEKIRSVHDEAAEILATTKDRADLNRLHDAITRAQDVVSAFGGIPIINRREVESLEDVERLRHILLLKIRNRDLYLQAVHTIGKMLLSVIWKQRHSRHPRVLVLYLMSGSNIEDAAHSLSFGVLPDIFVNISTISGTGGNRCLSRSQSTVKSQIPDTPCEWHEKILMVIENEADLLVLNVMSTAALTGDSFVGQAVIDLKHYPSLNSPDTIVRTNSGVHGRLEYPIFDMDGKPMPKEDIPGSYEGGGVLRLGLSIPRWDKALCGWFTEVFQTVFGGEESRKIFVVLHDHTIGVFSSPLCGTSGLLRQIQCHNISKIEEKQAKSHETDRTIHSLRITIVSSTGNEEKMIWIFDDLSLELKGLWYKALQIKHSFSDTVLSCAHEFDGGGNAA